MGKHYYDPAFDGLHKITQAQTLAGDAYTGTMKIGPNERDGHAIEWKTKAGNYEGVGLAIDGKLWLAFGQEGEFGLAVYSLCEEGMESVFTGPSFKGAVGQEKVFGCKGFDQLNQTYETEGQQADNVKYKGKIAIAEYGALYLLTWAFYGETGRLNGVGMVRDGKFLTGYSVPGNVVFGCGLYERTPEGGLKGEWAIPTYKESGWEYLD
jgi:hypothetical protein